MTSTTLMFIKFSFEIIWCLKIILVVLILIFLNLIFSPNYFDRSISTTDDTDLLDRILPEADSPASPYLIRLLLSFFLASPASRRNPPKQIYTQLRLLLHEASLPLLSLSCSLSLALPLRRGQGATAGASVRAAGWRDDGGHHPPPP